MSKYFNKFKVGDVVTPISRYSYIREGNPYTIREVTNTGSIRLRENGYPISGSYNPDKFKLYEEENSYFVISGEIIYTGERIYAKKYDEKNPPPEGDPRALRWMEYDGSNIYSNKDDAHRFATWCMEYDGSNIYFNRDEAHRFATWCDAKKALIDMRFYFKDKTAISYITNFKIEKVSEKEEKMNLYNEDLKYLLVFTSGSTEIVFGSSARNKVEEAVRANPGVRIFNLSEMKAEVKFELRPKLEFTGSFLRD